MKTDEISSCHDVDPSNQLLLTPTSTTDNTPKSDQSNHHQQQKHCLGALDMIDLPAYAYTQIPERYFMSSLIKHTAIAVVIIMSLALISIYN